MVKQGSCHCGAVTFTVKLPEVLRGARCDCSICRIKGAVTVGAPLDSLEIMAGEEWLTLYEFNTRTAKHYFCSRCGTYTFHRRRADPHSYGINVACLDLDPYRDFVEVPVLDGANHSSDTGEVRLAGTLRFVPNGTQA